jgi:hypothetical protein
MFLFGEYRQKDWVDVISEDGLRMSVLTNWKDWVDVISEEGLRMSVLTNCYLIIWLSVSFIFSLGEIQLAKKI